MDAGGNAYVTGNTLSTDFPTVGALQPLPGGSGSYDAFLAKLNAAGSALVYSTYLGGAGQDEGVGIAVDTAGSAFITGTTNSADFPTANPLQPTLMPPAKEEGDFDAFVVKLNPAGSTFVYSTYLGGGGRDVGTSIAVDAAGNAYITGFTTSPDFPLVNPVQPAFGGSFDSGENVFVAKLGEIPDNTPVGTNVVVQPIDQSATLTFADVTGAGVTSLIRRNDGPAPPNGFSLGTPPIYYDITTTATFTPPVTVCITYDPLQVGDPSSLRLLHYEGGVWVDTTTSNDTMAHVICGSALSLSPFIVAQQVGVPLTSLGPVRIWVGLKNSDDVGIRFDLRAEARRNGTQLVGSGELASVPGGSSGFNNAKLNAITLTPVGGAAFQSGDMLSITVYVRNACSGSGKNSGGARLWFNDSAANSRFDATIGSPATYFLRDGFSLATTPGPGPKKTVDVAAGAKCSPYKTFGTWSTTLP